MLETASGSFVVNARGKRVRVEYRGHYVIVFGNTNPEDGTIQINNSMASREDLLTLLMTGQVPEAARGLSMLAVYQGGSDD
jgi:hypothetical protein